MYEKVFSELVTNNIKNEDEEHGEGTWTPGAPGLRVVTFTRRTEAECGGRKRAAKPKLHVGRLGL